MRELTPAWAINSTCSEGQVVGRRTVGAGPSVWVVAVRANGSTGSVWRGAGVRTVHVVHGFP